MPTIDQLPLHIVPSVAPETFISEVDYLLRSEPLGVVALVGDEQFMGTFDRDDAKNSYLIPSHADRALLAVGPYAQSRKLTARPEDDAAEILDAMRHFEIDYVPVVQNVTFLGMVTRTDIEKAIQRKN